MNRYSIIIFIILLLPVFISKANSQNYTNFQFKKIGVDTGLSESSVYCVLQDTKGFMWFGTKDGLNRYDGSKFRTFRYSKDNTHSIGNNFIRSIAQVNDNTIYLGTDAGVYMMNTYDETFTKLTTATKEQIRMTSAINSLLVDKDGFVWIGSMHQGIFRYDPKRHILQRIPVLKTNLDGSSVWTIYQDKSGTIWAGSRMGLLRYNKDIYQFEPVKGLFDSKSETEYETLSIYEDDKGNLWLGTWDHGLKLYNKQDNGLQSFFTKTSPTYITHIRTLFRYSEHNILVGSDDGLYLLDINNYNYYRIDIPQLHHSLSDQNIYSISKDTEGGLWIGTYFGGINYLTPSISSIETYYPDRYPGTLSGKAVSQFCEDPQGNIWIATEDGGINYFNVTTKRITQPIQTTYHNTHALLLDGDNLMIGTFSRGIDIYNTKTKSIKNLRNSISDANTLDNDCIFSLYKTRNGTIYAGSTMGLNLFHKESNSFTRVNEVTGFIYDMKEDDYSNLWIATYGTGVIRYNYESKKWTYYDQILKGNDPIVGSKLTGIYIDSQKRLLFSSEGRGIFLYDYRTDRFSNISESDKLPNNVVYGILDDHFGNLWLSCNKGLVCTNTANPEQYKLYTKEDGLQSNQFNFKSSYKSRDGKLYFGGVNGFSCFYPQDLINIKNPIIPPVEITRINILGDTNEQLAQELQTKLNMKQKIELRYNQASFTISFVSLSYISQNKNQYAYKLEGVDNDWNYVGNTQNVTYVNLPPGEYTFKVKASNNDNIWNNEGTSVSIKILPPFWLSIPALIVYTLLVLLSIYGTINYFIRKNKNKQKHYLESIKNEQETLAFKSKIEFFTNIAHEIRTPLSLINAPLEEIINTNNSENNTKQNLEIIEKNCERLNILINQLLDFRNVSPSQYIINAEKLNLNKFLTELYDRFKKTIQKKNIEFNLSLPPSNVNTNVTFDADALTKIIDNLLTNALKYTSNRIDLKLIPNNDNSFHVLVIDNGKGISDNNKQLIFDPFYQISKEDKNIGYGIGLSLVKFLSDKLGCQIRVSDNSGGGSIFTFTVRDIQIDNTPEKPETKDQNDQTSGTLNRQNEPKSRYTILVVDDNADMSAYLKKSLENEYIVNIANDVKEAFILLDGELVYDLIISDIMMPEIDGIAFTKKLKEDINYSHIPLILLSAKTENWTKVEGLRSGADVFIEKPFSMLYIKAQISSMLENRRSLLENFNKMPFASYSLLTSNKRDETFFNKINEEIEKHISEENFSVESLSEILGMSRSNLQRKLKSICGVTPGDYLRDYRLKKACKILLETDLRINEVAFMVGFNSASYFTKAFIKSYGMSPKEFIKENLGSPSS